MACGCGALLQYLALRRLGITKVHHLVQQLVNNDKVVPDTLLLELLEVFRKHLDDLVQEKEDLGGIRIPFRKREKVEIVVTDVKVLKRIPVSMQCPADATVAKVRCAGRVRGCIR